MKHVYLSLVVLFIVGVKSVHSQCTPAPNDNCANAQVLTVNGGTVPGSTCGTLEAGEKNDCGPSTHTQSVWYSFVATSPTLAVSISSTGSCFLTSAVWKSASGSCPIGGACHALSCQSSTNGPTTTVHRLSNLVIGETYYVQILYTPGGTCGLNGTFNIGVSTTIPATVSNGPPISTCDNVSSTACVFNYVPSITTITNSCPSVTNPTSANGANEVVKSCFTFVGQYSTNITFQNIINSTCIGGNVVWFAWELLDMNCNSYRCGDLSNLSTTGVVCGTQYKMCYTYEIPNCTHTRYYPYVSAIPVPMNNWTSQSQTSTTASICPGDSVTLFANAQGYVNYQWSPATGLSSTTGSSVIAFPASTTTYTITGFDSGGCSQTKTVQVIVRPKPTPTVTPSNSVLTCAAPNATLTATGGGTYRWSNGSTTSSITTNIPGTYTVTVTGANTCTATAEATVTQSTSSVVATITPLADTLTCQRTNVTLTAGGGATYLWSNGATSSTINVTTPGTYTVTATDLTGCAGSASVSIIQNITPPQVSVTPPGLLTCSNTSTSLRATGGGTYQWSSGSVSDSITVSSPGTYSVIVTDPANGCTASASQVVNNNITPPPVSIAPPAQLTCTVTSINVVASSSTVNASFNWGGNNTGPSLTVTSPGAYSVTVTDPANGCTASASVNVTLNQNLITTFNNTPALCQGGSTGAVDLTITGGQSPYTFQWSNQATTEDLSSVPAGNYSVTITDNGGCSTTASTSVSEPQALNVSETHTGVSCSGSSDGVINLNATGGTGAYNYTWNDGATSSSRNNLGFGNYSVTVSDNNQCSVSLSITISQASTIEVFNVKTDISCYQGRDGNIDISARGGNQPYSFKWNDGANTEDRSQIPAGTYTITVTDANQCTATASISINEPSALAFTQQVNQPTCPDNNGDGSIALSPSGATPPYRYSWSNGGNTPDKTGLSPGTYTVTITDDNSCSVTISFAMSYQYNFTVDASPTVSTIEPGQTVTLNYSMNGSAGTVTSQKWTPGQSLSCDDCPSPVAAPQTTTTYQVEVTNDAGCAATDIVIIYVTPVFSLYVPNVFTPNSDGFNDFFELYGNRDGIAFLEIQLFNRWGEKIFESNDHYFKWDGRYKGEPLVPQALTWQLRLGFVDGHVEEVRKGSITLLK